LRRKPGERGTAFDAFPGKEKKKAPASEPGEGGKRGILAWGGTGSMAFLIKRGEGTTEWGS